MDTIKFSFTENNFPLEKYDVDSDLYVEFCKINGLHVVLPQKQTHIFKRKLLDGTIYYYEEDLYNAEEVETALHDAGVVFK